MKVNKFLLLLIFAFTFITLSSQDVGFPEESAVWTYAYSQDSWDIPSSSSITLEGDTVLLGLTYQKISGGFIRTENKRVYFLPSDSTEAFLLYDFNLELGDIFLNKYPENNGPDTIYVIQVDSIMTEAGYRKRWEFGPNYGTWIDGVGSTWSLTSPVYSQSVSGQHYLFCFENEGESIIENDIVYYTGYYYEKDTLRCYNPLVSTQEPYLEKEKTIISPTPTRYSFKILSPRIPIGTSIQIYNTNGQFVKQVNYGGEIFVQNLASGVYFLSFIFEGEQFFERLVKI